MDPFGFADVPCHARYHADPQTGQIRGEFATVPPYCSSCYVVAGVVKHIEVPQGATRVSMSATFRVNELHGSITPDVSLPVVGSGANIVMSAGTAIDMFGRNFGDSTAHRYVYVHDEAYYVPGDRFTLTSDVAAPAAGTHRFLAYANIFAGASHNAVDATFDMHVEDLSVSFR